MKKIIYSLMLGIIFISCSTSPEDKAKRLIKDHLHETLHDEKSYESVSYGGLDSVYTTVLDNKAYLTAATKCQYFKEEFDEALKDAELYAGMYSSVYRNKYQRAKDRAQKNIDSLSVYAPIADSIHDNFIPEFKGWSMKHSYRANNASGNKIIGHFRFYFDENITEVVNSEDIGENAK